MKIGFISVFLMFFIALQAPVLLAGDTSELRAEADQYYLDDNYKKAYKIYFKLAKTGDHHSQGRVAQMLTNGEGKSVDLTEAYAWSVLAEEGSKEVLTQSSDVLLQRTSDQSVAQKKALKLKGKYGQQVLKEKALKRAQADAARRSGNSLGSNLSR
jgi:TPR repeat protein